MHLTNRFAIVVVTIVALNVVVAGRGLVRSGAKAPVEVHEAIKAGVAHAKATGKTVWLDFGASWCSWCTRLDEALRSPDLSRIFADNFVVVKLSAEERDDKKALENPGATDMMHSEGGEGLPFYIFLDKDGKKLADSMVMPKHVNIGYPGTDDEIKAFGELLQKTAPRMTAADRARITDYLKAHAPKPDPDPLPVDRNP